MTSENPVSDRQRLDETERKVGTEGEAVSCIVDSQPVADRRKLFRRLMALAGLGITGALLSQDKTGLLPRAAANPGVTTVSSGTNASSYVAFWDAALDITSNLSGNFTWDAFNGLYSEATLYGVNGVANASTAIAVRGDSSAGIGVYGESSSGVGVKGQSGTTGVPFVALGALGQAANLQEWQKTGSGTLSVVDANGNFGIGTTIPDKMLTLYNGVSSADNVELRLANADANVGDTQLIGFGDAPGATINYVEAGAVIDTGASMAFIVKTKNFTGSGAPIERLRITGAGKVGIGTSSPTDLLHGYSTSDAVIRLVGDGTGSAFSFEEYYPGVGGPGLYIKSARGSFTTPANLQVGDRMGQVVFSGYAGGTDGSAFRNVAGIEGWVDAGTVSSTSLPSYLAFKTTPNLSIARTERMRIDENGNVGIGTTAPKSPLHVVGLPVYANNTAAIAGGLTAGALYRTGANPDPVCVVH